MGGDVVLHHSAAVEPTDMTGHLFRYGWGPATARERDNMGWKIFRSHADFLRNPQFELDVSLCNLKQSPAFGL